jgi:hypothetical protein
VTASSAAISSGVRWMSMPQHTPSPSEGCAGPVRGR